MSDDPADRMVRLRVARQRVRRHRSTSVVVAACLAVGVLAVAVTAVPAVLGHSPERSSVAPVQQTGTTPPTVDVAVAAPVLVPARSGRHERSGTVVPGHGCHRRTTVR